MRKFEIKIATLAICSVITLTSCDEFFGVEDNPINGGNSSADNSEIIVFKDSYVEGLLAQYFDKNNDYKISMAEANSVVDLQNIFKENEHITSFDELQYFTRLKYINFKRCRNLKSITIPGNVETIESETFSDCYNLESVTLQEGIKKIEVGAFSSVKLKTITIPASVNDISVFSIESGILENIVVDKGNKTYDSREDCNCIIETASNKIIRGCLNSIIPNSIKTIGASAFFKLIGLQNITLPEGLEEIEFSAFYGTGLTEIVIPSSVKSIGDGCFADSQLTKVTIMNTVPPTLGDDCFLFIEEKNFTIYVPSSSVDTYKSGSNWSDYANYIKAID